jgi:hypothetical protein
MLIDCAACAMIIAADKWRHPQHMAIMNLVWPIAGLYAGPLALWGYFSYGQLAAHERAKRAAMHGRTPPHLTER